MYSTPELYEAKIVKARKDHRCFECHKPIRKGRNYEKVDGKWDGDFGQYKTCYRCLFIRERLDAAGYFEDGYGHGDLIEIFEERQSSRRQDRKNYANKRGNQ